MEEINTDEDDNASNKSEKKEARTGPSSPINNNDEMDETPVLDDQREENVLSKSSSSDFNGFRNEDLDEIHASYQNQQ